MYHLAGWNCVVPNTIGKAYYTDNANNTPFTNTHYNSEDKYRYALYKKNQYNKPTTPGKYVIKSSSINTHIGDVVLWFFDSTKVLPNGSRVEEIPANKWSQLTFKVGATLKKGQQYEITTDVLDKDNLDSIAFAHVKNTGDNFTYADMVKYGHDFCFDVEFVANPDGSSDPPGPISCPTGFESKRYSQANSISGRPDPEKQIITYPVSGDNVFTAQTGKVFYLHFVSSGTASNDIFNYLGNRQRISATSTETISTPAGATHYILTGDKDDILDDPSYVCLKVENKGGTTPPSPEEADLDCAQYKDNPDSKRNRAYPAKSYGEYNYNERKFSDFGLSSNTITWDRWAVHYLGAMPDDPVIRGKRFTLRDDFEYDVMIDVVTNISPEAAKHPVENNRQIRNKIIKTFGPLSPGQSLDIPVGEDEDIFEGMTQDGFLFREDDFKLRFYFRPLVPNLQLATVDEGGLRPCIKWETYDVGPGTPPPPFECEGTRGDAFFDLTTTDSPKFISTAIYSRDTDFSALVSDTSGTKFEKNRKYKFTVLSKEVDILFQSLRLWWSDNPLSNRKSTATANMFELSPEGIGRNQSVLQGDGTEMEFTCMGEYLYLGAVDQNDGITTVNYPQDTGIGVCLEIEASDPVPPGEGEEVPEETPPDELQQMCADNGGTIERAYYQLAAMTQPQFHSRDYAKPIIPIINDGDLFEVGGRYSFSSEQYNNYNIQIWWSNDNTWDDPTPATQYEAGDVLVKGQARIVTAKGTRAFLGAYDGPKDQNSWDENGELVCVKYEKIEDRPGGPVSGATVINKGNNYPPGYHVIIDEEKGGEFMVKVNSSGRLEEHIVPAPASDSQQYKIGDKIIVIINKQIPGSNTSGGGTQQGSGGQLNVTSIGVNTEDNDPEDPLVNPDGVRTYWSPGQQGKVNWSRYNKPAYSAPGNGTRATIGRNYLFTNYEEYPVKVIWSDSNQHPQTTSTFEGESVYPGQSTVMEAKAKYAYYQAYNTGVPETLEEFPLDGRLANLTCVQVQTEPGNVRGYRMTGSASTPLWTNLTKPLSATDTKKDREYTISNGNPFPIKLYWGEGTKNPTVGGETINPGVTQNENQGTN